jgi:sarcosine oxidase subunit gamma
MAEAAIRTAPVPTEPAIYRGATIELAPPLARYSLRARDPKALAKLLARDVPETIGTTKGELACLGPDEWLLRTPIDTVMPDCSGQLLSVVDVSERAVTLVVEGPRAAEVLMAGCPRDLDKFAVGQAARTVFETVEIIVLRTGAERFEIEVWRSFAPWLHLALSTAAAHLV